MNAVNYYKPNHYGKNNATGAYAIYTLSEIRDFYPDRYHIYGHA